MGPLLLERPPRYPSPTWAACAQARRGLTEDPAGRAAGSVLAGLRAEPVDLLRGLRLVQVGRDLLAGLPRQGVEVAALGAGHRLVAGYPGALVLLGDRALLAAQRPG